MERIWLKHYPPGVPAEIDPSKYASLIELFEENLAKYRDRQAFVCMDKALTYGEVDELSRALAAWLQGQGLQSGARVALMMPNILQYPVALMAVLRAGLTVVNVNPLYTPRELEIQLKDSGAEAIIILENFAHNLAQVITHTKIRHILVASMGDMLGPIKGAVVNLVVRYIKKMVPAYSLGGVTSFNDALKEGRDLNFVTPTIGPDSVAFLQYTGGTTGVAKGAILLHRNMVANTLQVDAWHIPIADKEAGHQAVMVTALPLYHVFALTACFLLGMRMGALCLLIPNPRDLPSLIRDLVKYKPNHFPAVNTLYNALLHHPDFDKVDWSHLRSAVGGGMAVQQAVAMAWFKRTGCPIIEGYGLSETSPVLTCNRVDNTEWTGTIGLPLPSTDIAIRDDANNYLPLGHPGEICARGPQLMAGYWQRADETALVMTPDGYFRTGDIGIMNATGQVTIVDRKKDMIDVSGLKVYPNEVETVIASHPGVLECAVVGVPDEHSGEAVKAYVVKKDPNLTAQDLIAFCKSQLTGYKIPRHIEFRTELPKTNVGKILRRELRPDAQ